MPGPTPSSRPPDSRDPIRDRIDDAHALREAGRLEGALLMACVAFAAAARRTFPDLHNDHREFTSLFGLVRPGPLEVEFRGKLEPFEELLYVWVRCEIAHVAGLPVDIGWIAGPGPEDLIVRAGGAPEYRLLISPGWIGYLLTIAEAFGAA